MSAQFFIPKIVEKLKVLSPKKIWLFGSLARGTESDSSDIDLLMVVQESSLPRYRRNQDARMHVRDIHYPKDIIVMTQNEWDKESHVKTSLVSTIIKEGKLLYG